MFEVSIFIILETIKQVHINKSIDILVLVFKFIDWGIMTSVSKLKIYQ